MDSVAASSTLSALAVFTSTVVNGVVRSVHGYTVVGKEGSGKWEKWVEREFTFSDCLWYEVPASTAMPRILPTKWRGRPVYHEGQMVGISWRCILAFDFVTGVAPPATPPPFFCPVRNPMLMSIPSLYNDLTKVFRFQSVVEKADEDPQYGEELPVHGQKQSRANQKYIASITLVDIAQYFHLPIKEASKALKIGVSILKKKCRLNKIPRWPHRKLKSLDSLIHDLEYVIDDTDRDDMQQKEHAQKEKDRQDAIVALAKRKRMLEIEKENIHLMPAKDLLVETKQFREDVFKRRYRAKASTIELLENSLD